MLITCCKKFLFVSLITIFVLSTNVYAQNTYRIDKVHDGDTVTIVIDSFMGVKLKKQKARLIGIDAPELKQGVWGKRAKNYLQKLIRENGGAVAVEYDVDKYDQHNRLLVYLRAKNGQLINVQMVLSGHAEVYTVPPNVKYTRQFEYAQQSARSAKRGIWGKNGLKERPSEYRHKHPRW